MAQRLRGSMAKHRRFQEADLRGVDGQPPMMAVYTGKSRAGTDDGAFEDDASPAAIPRHGWIPPRNAATSREPGARPKFSPAPRPPPFICSP